MHRLVVGDPYSGVIHVIISVTKLSEVTVVDDGTATLEFARQWAAGEQLSRWHQAGRRLATGDRLPRSRGIRLPGRYAGGCPLSQVAGCGCSPVCRWGCTAGSDHPATTSRGCAPGTLPRR